MIVFNCFQLLAIITPFIDLWFFLKLYVWGSPARGRVVKSYNRPFLITFWNKKEICYNDFTKGRTLIFPLASNRYLRVRIFSYNKACSYSKSVLDNLVLFDKILGIQTKESGKMKDVIFIGLLILFVIACATTIMALVLELYIGAVFCFGYMLVSGYAMQQIANLFFK